MPSPFLSANLSPSPAEAVAPVTKSDTVDLARIPCRSLWIGGAGDVAVVCQDGSVATIAGVNAGTLLPIAVKRVNSTNTTATSIVALY